MNVYIRTDASDQIGSGHVMRCMTLAKALKQQGGNIRFLCRQHPGNLIELIQQQGFEALQLPRLNSTSELPGYAAWLGCPEEQDAIETAQLLKQDLAQKDLSKAELLIVDHYGLGQAFTQQLKPCFQHRLVIDDLANRKHQCETLLDQNLLPDLHHRYQGKVNDDCKCLLGPEFALLREEFYQAKPEVKPEHLLVFFGGSDPWQLTLKTVTALQELTSKDIGHLQIDIVIGHQHPDRAELAANLANMPNAQLHIQTQQMAQLMSKARLMLGAGGSTHWERCFMGVPGLVVTVAENQQPTTEYLAERGACIWLGHANQITTSQISQALQKTLNDGALLKQLSHKASQIVPREGGTQAVVKHLMNQLGKNPQ